MKEIDHEKEVHNTNISHEGIKEWYHYSIYECFLSRDTINQGKGELGGGRCSKLD